MSEDVAQLFCLDLESRSEPPNETNLPFFQCKIYTIKGESMHCYKPHAPRFLLLPQSRMRWPPSSCSLRAAAQLMLANGTQGGLLSHDKSASQRAVWSSLAIQRKRMALNHGAEGRKKNAQL